MKFTLPIRTFLHMVKSACGAEKMTDQETRSRCHISTPIHEMNPTPEEAPNKKTSRSYSEKDKWCLLYLAESICRVASLSPEEVNALVLEINNVEIIDQIDYASTNTQHWLENALDQYFNGLELCCLIYVGIKTTCPDYTNPWNVGVDLNALYEDAQSILRSGGPSDAMILLRTICNPPGR